MGYHIASSAALAACGSWQAAIGAMLPDIAWLPNEWRIQRSPHTAQQVIDRLGSMWVMPYRITHSVLLWGLVAMLNWQVALGALVHVLLDLPTHDGRMRQMPLYPFKWRWPWVFRT